MTNVIPGMKEAQFSLLFERKRRKNSYQQLKEGAYPRMFRKQLKATRNAVEKAVNKGKLRDTKMVRIDERSGAYLLSIGFGAKNTWFENDALDRGEFAEFGSASETLPAIDALIKLAKAGKFDKGLEALREKRQAHAEKMISRRKVDSFLLKDEVSRRNAMLPEEQLKLAA